MNRVQSSVWKASLLKFHLWIIVWCGSCFFVFRDIFQSGFDRLLVDELDGRLIVRLHEHWFRFFSGRAEWLELGMFYPAENSLGLSDTFFLHGIGYSCFRALGFDIFHSAMANLLFLSFVGYAGFWLLAKRIFRFSFSLSVCLAALFVVLAPINIAGNYSHLQMYSVWYLPWICFCLARGIHVDGGQVIIRFGWFSASLVGFAACLYNAVYVPWSFAIYIGLLGLAWSAFSLMAGEDAWGFFRRIGGVAKQVLRQRSFWFSTVLGALALVPFFLTYLPVLNDSSGHNYSVILQSLPAWDHLINVSAYSYFWGWLGETGLFPNASMERAYGFPVLTFLCVCSSFVFCLRYYQGSVSGVRSRVFVVSIVLAVVLFWLLAVRWGAFSLWRIVYEIVPGGSAIRVVDRFNAVLCLPVLLVLGVCYERIFNRVRSRIVGTLIGLVGICLLVWDQTLVPLDRGEWALKRSEQIEWASGIEDAPEDIDAFFVKPYEEGGGLFNLKAQLDAWAIAQDRDMQSINGYSGILPRGFEMQEAYRSRGSSGYLYRVRDWLARNDFAGSLAELDLNTGSWQRYESPAEFFQSQSLSLDRTVHFGRDRFSENPFDLYQMLEYGWSWPEGGATWTDWREAGLAFELDGYVEDRPYRLEFLASAYFARTLQEQRFRVYVNETELEPMVMTPSMGWSWVSVDVPPGAAGGSAWRVRIECPNATSPSSVSDNPDSRLLGLWLKAFKVSSVE